MILSVTSTKANPYFSLVHEKENNYIEKFAKSKVLRRQDCPTVYQINGAIYIIRTDAFVKKGLSEMSHIGKYLMPERYSIDIDTSLDLEIAEFILSKE